MFINVLFDGGTYQYEVLINVGHKLYYYNNITLVMLKIFKFHHVPTGNNLLIIMFIL